MNRPPERTLSADGERRRATMLPALVDEMQSLHRRRRARRRAVGATALAVVALSVTITVVIIGPKSGQPAAPVPVTALPTVPEDAAPRETGITIVRTAPDILDRYRPRRRGSAIESLDDRALVSMLASIDRPSGLIRSGDRAWLTAKVTDAERAGPQPTDKPSL